MFLPWHYFDLGMQNGACEDHTTVESFYVITQKFAQIRNYIKINCVLWFSQLFLFRGSSNQIISLVPKPFPPRRPGPPARQFLEIA